MRGARSINAVSTKGVGSDIIGSNDFFRETNESSNATTLTASFLNSLIEELKNLITQNGTLISGFENSNDSQIKTALNNLFLRKANTSSYTPQSDYNPATKKYVDDKITPSATISDILSIPDVLDSTGTSKTLNLSALEIQGHGQNFSNITCRYKDFTISGLSGLTKVSLTINGFAYSNAGGSASIFAVLTNSGSNTTPLAIARNEYDSSYSLTYNFTKSKSANNISFSLASNHILINNKYSYIAV